MQPKDHADAAHLRGWATAHRQFASAYHLAAAAEANRPGATRDCPSVARYRAQAQQAKSLAADFDRRADAIEAGRADSLVLA